MNRMSGIRTENSGRPTLAVRAADPAHHSLQSRCQIRVAAVRRSPDLRRRGAATYTAGYSEVGIARHHFRMIFNPDCEAFSLPMCNIESGFHVCRAFLPRGVHNVIFVQRIRSSPALAVALALGACTAPPTGDPSSSAADAGVEIDIVSRVRRPPPPPPPDACTTTPDASVPTGGGDPGQPGVFSCYTEGNPGATCSSPSHCCFSNYSSAHDGACSTAACTWGTESCDGPEDCASGQH